MFWRKKPKPPVDLDAPRDHHYVFAHVALRRFCAEHPLRFFAIMGSPDRDGFVDALWEATENHVGRKVEGFDRHETKVTTCRYGERRIIVVTMPAARAMAEAHYVALVLAPIPADHEPAQPLAFRCFTLEKGHSLETDAPRTVLCEWAEDSHLNFGDGPPATIDDFVAAVADKLNGDGADTRR